jgi:uncharacterized protein with von Willebrand factor type A (vWA) domain
MDELEFTEIRAAPELTSAVFDVDLFGEAKGKELARLRSPKLLSDASTRRVKSSALEPEFHASNLPSTVDWTDAFAAVYHVQPKPKVACSDEAKRLFFLALLGDPSFEAARLACGDDISLAEEVAESVVKSLCAHRETIRYIMDEIARMRAEMDAMPPSRRRDARRKLEIMEKRPEAVTEALGHRAAEEALSLIEKIAAFLADAMRVGGGFGEMEDDEETRLDPAKIRKIAERMRKSKKLQSIFDMMGRYKAAQRGMETTRTYADFGDMYGVELGNRILDLLPMELALFTVPELQAYQTYLFVQEALLQSSRILKKPKAKGPLAIIIDESGSMLDSGGIGGTAKVNCAKGLGMALADMARRQKRWCALVAYSGNNRGKGRRRPLVLLPGVPWNQERILDWLEKDLSGGGDVDLPIGELPEVAASVNLPPGGDIIMISDANLYVDEKQREIMLNWKSKTKTRVVALVIGSRDGMHLKQVCEAVYQVPAMRPGEEGIEKALTI